MDSWTLKCCTYIMYLVFSLLQDKSVEIFSNQFNGLKALSLKCKDRRVPFRNLLWKIYDCPSRLHVVLDKDINWATRKRLRTTQDVRVKCWGWCTATWGKIPSSRCSLDSHGLIYRSRTICICIFMPPNCSFVINGPNWVCCNSAVSCRLPTTESVAIFYYCHRYRLCFQRSRKRKRLLEALQVFED